MEFRELTHFQIETVHAQVMRQVRYLNRLIQRMDRRGIVPTDRVYQSTLRARDAVLALSVRLHYSRCRTGVALDP